MNNFKEDPKLEVPQPRYCARILAEEYEETTSTDDFAAARMP